MQTAVKPINDAEIIKRLYREPEFQSIAHDHRGAEPVFHSRAQYLGAYVQGELAGLFLAIRTSFLEVDLHALIRRQFLRFARALGHDCINHVFADTAIQRATAYIVQGRDSTINYTKKLGFQHEGMRRCACSVNGRLLGVHTMGLTRADWEAM